MYLVIIHTLSQKKQHRQPSIIDSDLDHCYSNSGSGSDSDSTQASRDSDIVVQEPIVVPQKHAKACATAPHTPIPPPTVNVSQTINFAVSVFSSDKMKKVTSKHVPKCLSFQLHTDEPWDTLKAQLLVKVSDALGDTAIRDFSKYNFIVSILCIVSKPGISLTSENDYDLLFAKIKAGKVKDPILANVTITQLNGVENGSAANKKAKKEGTKDRDILPGNVEKTNNIQMLQQRWKCNKQQNNCIGVYCYINSEGNHVSLSHQRLDC